MMTSAKPKRTHEEQDILDLGAKRSGQDWVDAYEDLILDQSRAMGELLERIGTILGSLDGRPVGCAERDVSHLYRAYFTRRTGRSLGQGS